MDFKQFTAKELGEMLDSGKLPPKEREEAKAELDTRLQGIPVCSCHHMLVVFCPNFKERRK